MSFHVFAIQSRSNRTKMFSWLVLLAGLLLLPGQALAAPLAQDQPVDLTKICVAVADETPTDGSDTLVLLDLDNAQTRIIGPTGTFGIEAIAFDKDRQLMAADYGQLGSLNLVTGAFTPLAQPFGTAGGSAGEITLDDVDSLGFNKRTNVLYGAHRRGQGLSDLLFLIDATTGAHIPNQFGPAKEWDYIEVEIIPDAVVGPLHNVDDLAVDAATGEIHAAINRSGAGGVLATIDPATGKATRISEFLYPTPNPSDPLLAGTVIDDMEGLAFTRSGQLYGSTGQNGPDVVDLNKLFLIDKDTGIGTEIGPFPADLQDYEALGCLTGEVAISLEKYTNGPGQAPEDADTPTGPNITPGDAVTWTYVISNTGEITLTNLILVDDQLGQIGPGGVSNCPPVDTPLGIGEKMTCTATGIAQPGQYANTAVVSGTTQIDPAIPTETVTDTDPSHYFGVEPRHRHREGDERRGCRQPNRADHCGGRRCDLDLCGEEHRQR